MEYAFSCCQAMKEKVLINPIVVVLFDSPILVGGRAKKPPDLTLDW